jgi:hypothetical protein
MSPVPFTLIWYLQCKQQHGASVSKRAMSMSPVPFTLTWYLQCKQQQGASVSKRAMSMSPVPFTLIWYLQCKQQYGASVSKRAMRMSPVPFTLTWYLQCKQQQGASVSKRATATGQNQAHCDTNKTEHNKYCTATLAAHTCCSKSARAQPILRSCCMTVSASKLQTDATRNTTTYNSV